jgi:hypothetical protein
MPGTQFGLDQRRFKIDLKFTLQFYGMLNHEPRPITEGGNDGFDHTIKCYIVRLLLILARTVLATRFA